MLGKNNNKHTAMDDTKYIYIAMRILMLMMTNLFAAMAISWIFNANFTTICPVVHMLTFSPNFFCVNRFPKTLAANMFS